MRKSRTREGKKGRRGAARSEARTRGAAGGASAALIYLKEGFGSGCCRGFAPGRPRRSHLVDGPTSSGQPRRWLTTYTSAFGLKAEAWNAAT